jgi:hypothetical protein
MPPLSLSATSRKLSFLDRIFGTTSDGDKVQKMISDVPKPDRSNGKGFITEFDDPRIQWVNDKLKVESDRLHCLADCRTMLDDGSYIYGPADQFCRWSTEGKLNFTFTGGSTVKAQRIVGDMLDRIGYNDMMRQDLLFNAIFIESFIKQNVSFSDDFMNLVSGVMNPNRVISEFQRGMIIGQIDELLLPPAETMFRNSNSQDKFDNPKQAFYQIPEPYNQQNTYQMNQTPQQYQEWFHNMFIIHPRWNHRRQKSQRYSRPALKSARKYFNRTELSSTDACIQRHLTATRLLVIYLSKFVETGEKPGATDAEIEAYAKDFVKKYPRGFNKAGTVAIESGANEIDSVGDLNITLSKPTDIFMHLELLFMSCLFPPQLAGWKGDGRLDGNMLDQLKKILEVNIGSVNNFEDSEWLLPLINFELALHGIFDTEVSIHHSDPSFDSKSVMRKTHLTEIEMSVRSRKDYYEKHIMPETGVPWETYFAQLISEEKKIAEANPQKTAFGTRKDSKEGLDKGASGSNKSPETTPVQTE